MLKGKRILLVEDEAMLSMVIDDMLKDEAATVIGPAATLGHAMQITQQALQEGGLDAAVLDLNIGGEKIWPVMDLLRRSGVPIVVQTGYVYFRSDSIIVLHKPYSSTAFMSAVIRAMENQALEV